MEVSDQSLVKGVQEDPSSGNTMEASNQSDQAGLSNQSLVKDKQQGRQFHKFMKLPPEIRDMIWHLVMPKRLILPRPSGFTLLPRLPMLAQVCSDSRSFVLRQGMLCYHEQWKKHPSTAWLNPEHDVVFCKDIPAKVSSHPISDKFLMDHATRIAIEERHLTHSLSYFIECTPSVKEVLVLMNTQSETFPNLTKSWDSATNKRVFGDDGWLCVDLEDDDEKDRAADTLLGPEKTFYLWWALTEKRWYRYRSFQKRWAECLEATKEQWLIDAYFLEENEERARGVPRAAMISFENQVRQHRITSRDVAWVKQTLARIPKLRPVFMVVDRFYSQSSIQQRRTRRKGEEPAYSFDNQLKRWEPRTEGGGSQTLFQPGAAQGSKRDGWEALMLHKHTRGFL
ncbi:hypothetical protein PG995_009847 [Apiospora arundinis]|uniref:2EXR domain-containing protein n=1 Tax=Apiospora arundinis TaxID=335852 RepID=A0ABR2JLK1_9PEZI